jgi:hypothetical protein
VDTANGGWDSERENNRVLQKKKSSIILKFPLSV